jgi:cyclophilin family peptidyl-prolyl cis-trans isomerase
MSIRSAFAVLLCALVWPALLPAAENSKPAEKTAPAAAGDAAQAKTVARDFSQAFDEFKQVLGKLQSLQSQFQVADDADRAAIAAEFRENVEKGNELVPRLQAAAKQAYEADPQNRDAGEFLMANLVDAVKTERFAEGARLAALLAAGGYSDEWLPNYAGVAEFATNDFARASVDLRKAIQTDRLDDFAKKMASQVNECAKLWKIEKDLRAGEEQSDDLPRVRLTTNKGDIVVELFENEAPNTTANFISLVDQHFYDGLKFHRVMPGFMAQVGDPHTGGKEALDYTIPCECTQENSRKHFGGSLSMANAGPNTGNSQIFLTFNPRPELNGMHTVFGRVVEGLDVLSALQRVDPDHAHPDVKLDEIIKATVIRKRDHEYKPQTISQQR